MSRETPRQYVESQKGLISDKRLTSLTLILDVCEELLRLKSTDFTYGHIGKLSSAKGGPAAQAIRNKKPSGLGYQALIARFREFHGIGGKRQRPSPRSDDLLDGISDPVQRARLELALEELKQKRGEVMALQALERKRAHITVTPSISGDADLPTASVGRVVSGQLLPSEFEALCRFDDCLARVGLTTDTRGRVMDANGDELFPVGFATGLRKVVGKTDESAVRG